MAHEITIRQDGFAEMAFVGETPWHELGQQLDQNADMATWRKAAGMDWTLESAPVHFEVKDNNEHHNLNSFAGQNVLYRSDTNAFVPGLGVQSLLLFGDREEHTGY